MAFALQFDGVNDYADFAANIVLSGDFDLSVKFNVYAGAGANARVLSTQPDGAQWIGRRSTTKHIAFWHGVIEEVTTTFTTDTDYTYRLVRIGPSVQWFINGTLESTFTNATTLTIPALGRLGGGSNNLLGYIQSFSVVGAHNYSPDDSDRSPGPVVLTDTVGGNDAAGINMPTDGSAWIDLGGSGGLTASITESGPSFTEQISATLSKAIEASITELGPSFTESISTNLSANITGSIGESGPAFTESISATLSTLTIQGNITESGPSFTDSISVDVQASLGLNASIAELGPSFTESVQASLDKAIEANISEYGPSFTDSIAISLTSEIDASIGEYGPSFIEGLSAKIPVKISVNAKNTIKVKRSANTVKIKRKSNILRVK
tara:strand:+ start:1985 stop:3127 length:1143 start_codon:yes stop_codon:yes gene_type:complete